MTAPHHPMTTPASATTMAKGAVLHPLRPVPTSAPETDANAVRGVPGGGRLYALDLARLLAMIFMMQGHVLDALVRTDVLDTAVLPWNAWHWIRGLTAPVFLMVSGAVHVFATKRDAGGRIDQRLLERRLRWALTIVGLGYLLVFPANRVWDLPFVPAAAWKAFAAVNILQLTGVSLILFLYVMQRTRSVADMGRRALTMAAGILVLSPVVSTVDWHAFLPGTIAAYLTPAQGTLFPIFPFAAYLFAGTAIGAYLHRIPDSVRDRHVERYAWPVGLVLVALSVVVGRLAVLAGIAPVLVDGTASAVLALQRMGYVLMIFSLAAATVRLLPATRQWAATFGAASLWIYVIHLVLLFGTPWYDGIGRTSWRSLDLSLGIAAAAVIMTATLLIAWCIVRIRRIALPSAVRRFGAGVAIGVIGWLLFV